MQIPEHVFKRSLIGFYVTDQCTFNQLRNPTVPRIPEPHNQQETNG